MSGLNLFQKGRDLSLAAARSNPAIDLDEGFFASIAGSYNAGRAFRSSNSEKTNRYEYVQGVLDKLYQATGEKFQNPEGLSTGARGTLPYRQMEYAKVRNRLSQLANDRPDLGLGLMSEGEVIKGGEEIGRQAVKTESEASGRRVSRSSAIGSFIGSAGATMVDPVNVGANILTLPIAPEGVLATAATEGTVGGASEFLVQGLNYDYRRRVDPNYTLADAAGEVALAAGGGAFVGGGVRGIARIFDAWPGKGAATRAIKDKANIVKRAAAAAKAPFRNKTPVTDAVHNAAVTKSSEDLMMGKPVELPPESFLAANARPGRVYDADGRSVGVNYEVVEARDLVPSHTDEFLPNPAFPQELQPRARERPITVEQVNSIANNLQPERLGPSPQADSGAPIVGPDGLVESGNGRVLAIRKAYRDGNVSSSNYRNYLKSQGFNVEGMENPVLIARRITEFTGEEPPVPAGMVRMYHSGGDYKGGPRWFSSNRQYAADYRSDLPLHYVDLPRSNKIFDSDIPEQTVDQGMTVNAELPEEIASQMRRVSRGAADERIGFVTAANRATAMRLSATEQALADARLIGGKELEQLAPGDVTTAANRGFVRSFLSKLPRAEQGSLVDAQGNLSMEGVRRVQAALLGRAYGDTVMLSRALEDVDSNIKAIAGALGDAAGSWSRLRDAVSRGAVPQGMDITDDLLEAVRMIMKARDEGVAFKDLLNQAEMFEGPSEIAKAIGKFLFRDGDMTKPAGRATIAEMLESYADEAQKNLAGERLFGDALDEGEILRTALGKAGRSDIGAAEKAAPAVDDLFSPGAVTPEQAAIAQGRLTSEAMEKAADDPITDEGVLMEANRIMAEDLLGRPSARVDLSTNPGQFETEGFLARVTGGGPRELKEAIEAMRKPVAQPTMVPVRVTDAAGNETEELRPLQDVMDELDEEIAAAERIEACATGAPPPAQGQGSGAPASAEMGQLLDVLKSPRGFELDEGGNVVGVKGVEARQANPQLDELLTALRAPKAFDLDAEGNVTGVRRKSDSTPEELEAMRQRLAAPPDTSVDIQTELMRQRLMQGVVQPGTPSRPPRIRGLDDGVEE